MIVVNGMEYRTHQQNLYANGKKVLAAYCNGNLVYPEREDTTLLKVIGHINTIIPHDHTGENPSASANSGENYTYHGGDGYRAKGCFCLVLRSHSKQLSFQNSTTMLPSAKWPLNGSYSGSSSRGDIYGPGNAWLVYLYQGSTAPMLPNGGGVHPLLGSDEMATHIINRGSYTRATMSAELLIQLDVSAPRACPFFADRMYVGLGYPYLNAEATPLKEYLDEVPADVNGIHRMYSYKRDIYYGFNWTIKAPTGRSFYVNLAPGARSGSTILCSHLKICTSSSSSSGYEVPYIICGTRQGVYREVQTTYKQAFRILNIPITDKIYSGSELTAPEEHLHPRIEDLLPYI